MKLLLDTNVVIWIGGFSERAARVRAALEDVTNEPIISAVVAWEVAIKFGLGRLKLPVPPEVLLSVVARDPGAVSLAITHDHALAVASLPPLHGDPFDRLLVAQALALDATLVTGDAVLAGYGCKTLLA